MVGVGTERKTLESQLVGNVQIVTRCRFPIRTGSEASHGTNRLSSYPTEPSILTYPASSDPVRPEVYSWTPGS